MIRRVLPALAAALLMLPALAPAQVKLLRHPAYSKGKIAFSYLGDIWISSENGAGIQRLTVNKARDQFPRFSPHGRRQWQVLVARARFLLDPPCRGRPSIGVPKANPAVQAIISCRSSPVD